MKVRLVVLPPASVCKLIGAVANQIGKSNEHNFIVDNKQFIPHVTLCRFYAHPKDFPKIIDAVRKVAQRQTPIKLTMKTGLSSHDNDVSWDVRKSAALANFRKQVHSAILNYNSNTDYTVLKSSYNPHITVAGYKSARDARAALKVVHLSKLVFPLNQIAFTVSGPYGQVPKVIKRFKLK